ncbi:MAG: NAD-dependent epimerase/dehydratase family protein [Candidatus Micrarchaeota archaeon]
MKTVVTGGRGFIGSRVAEALSAETYDATDGQDILDAKKLEQAFEGAGTVMHLAALTGVPQSFTEPLAFAKNNFEGTVNVLEAARKSGVKTIVFASSASVYGDNPKNPKTENMLPQPASPYAATKIAGEHLLDAYAGQYGMRCVSLRLFNVYGPGQNSRYSAAIPSFIKSALRNEPVAVNGDGRQTRDFVFVEDAAQAFALAAKKGSGAYNIGSGSAATVADVAKKIVALAGSQSKIVFTPARPGDVRESLADISKARRELGYAPKTALEDGLKITMKGFLK